MTPPPPRVAAGAPAVPVVADLLRQPGTSSGARASATAFAVATETPNTTVESSRAGRRRAMKGPSTATRTAAAPGVLTLPAPPLDQDGRGSAGGTGRLSNRANATLFLITVKEKLDRGEYIAEGAGSAKPAAESAFNVWDHFKVIRSNKTRVAVGAVLCTRCQRVMRWDSVVTGNTSIKNHALRSCPGPAAAANGFLTASRELKETSAKSVVKVTAKTMTCMNDIASEPNIELLQLAIDIGVEHGRMDARELMRHAATTSTKLGSEAKKAREEVSEEVLEAIRDRRCSCTTDMWTDNQTQTSYIEVTAHYADKIFETQTSRYLIMVTVPATPVSSGANTRAVMKEAMFTRLGVTDADFDKIEWVTDRSDVKKALEGQCTEDCAAHLINTVLKSTLTLTYVELRQKALRGSEAALAACKRVEEVARVLKQQEKGMNVPFRKEDVALSSYNAEKRKPTRLQDAIVLPQPHLSSYGAMLQSILSHKREVCAALREKRREDILLALDEHELQELANFLVPIEKAGDVPARGLKVLERHLEHVSGESACVTEMKEALRSERLLIPILLQVKLCRDLVTYLKTSGHGLLLKKKVVQEVETRWSSLCTMLESLMKQFDRVSEVLTAARQRSRMRGINMGTVAWLVDFLKPFKDQTTKIEGEGEEYPTLPLVVLSTYTLRKHCSASPLDNVEQEAFRSRACAILEEKMKPSMKQKIATFLIPKYRKLLMLQPEEREEVFDEVRRVLDGQKDAAPGAALEPLASPPPKRPRVDEEYEDEWAVPSTAPMDEVSLYLDQAPAVDVDDMVPFWKGELSANTSRFKRLGKLAHRELGKPATSAPSERVFSCAGFLIQARRHRLDPSTVDNILFLHLYFLNQTKKKKRLYVAR